MLTIGIIGKTNTGKTTLFNAATLLDAKISNFPFTTKKPNIGTAYVSDICVHKELGVEDNPQNSVCIDGWRYAPIRLIDIPGLLKDAWTGRGLGNRFLAAMGQADALIHVVDASGSIDAEGQITQPGSGNPVQDAMDIESELNKWIADIIERNNESIAHQTASLSLEEAMAQNLSALKVKPYHIKKALIQSDLNKISFRSWTLNQTLKFSATLLPIIKPTLIVANKMDILTSEKYFEILTNFYGQKLVAACSAKSELILRRAQKAGLVQYTPGQEIFKITKKAELNPNQQAALDYIQKRVLNRYFNTGIQQALNIVVFKLLKTNMIYPVSDEHNYMDHKKNILPDVHLLPKGSTPVDLAKQVHTRLAQNYILAIDAKTGIRLPKEHILNHKDVIKIVTRKTAKKKTKKQK
ncbi:MAG: YchF-related putative GTPase [Candidatus Bathyarchaeota archaeon]|nr:YchF-related putative GTPase [Candidatus Bathyarchaeota archaeon]